MLPTLVWIWEIMREPYMRDWATANERSRGCTGKCKAAEDAAWEVLLSHEIDNPEDTDEDTEATITGILDLAKAFENVSLSLLWEIGGKIQFRAGVLAVVGSCFQWQGAL